MTGRFHGLELGVDEIFGLHHLLRLRRTALDLLRLNDGTLLGSPFLGNHHHLHHKSYQPAHRMVEAWWTERGVEAWLESF